REVLRLLDIVLERRASLGQGRVQLATDEIERLGSHVRHLVASTAAGNPRGGGLLVLEAPERAGGRRRTDNRFLRRPWQPEAGSGFTQARRQLREFRDSGRRGTGGVRGLRADFLQHL